MRILVVTTCTPNDRKTLCSIRALGRAGNHVIVGGDRSAGQAFYSRYAAGRVHIPHPGTNLDGFIRVLGEQARNMKIDAILPSSDYTTVACSQRREELLVSAALAVPAAGSLSRAQNKLGLSDLAGPLGIRTPRTWCPRDLDEARELAETLDFPCVFKLRRSTGAIGLTFPASALELLADWTASRPDSDSVFEYQRPLVQEFVQGPVHDVCALMCRGEPRALITQKRLLTLPPEGGAGVLVETTHNPDLAERAAGLLRALNWHGPAQVEFKIPPGPGEPILLEINGRLWGTLDLALAAGIDIPRMTCEIAIDGDTEEAFDYPIGLRYRWPFPAGLIHAWQSRRLFAAARSFFLPAADTGSNTWFRDPLPHLAEAALTAGLVWNRVFSRPA